MGQYRALLVANSKFYVDPDHLPELKAPIYDMARLQDALVHPGTGVFDREQVRLLPNARCSDLLVTMDDFLQSSDPDDTMLLYYSGHGKLDINNNFFLCAADTRLDRLMSTAVRDEQVNAMIKSSPARTFVVILDCCSSGAWKSPTDVLPEALKGVGRFLLASSRAGQNSGDAAVETESSAFTKLLVEALGTADLDTDRDGFIDIDEVYKHVEERLRVEGQQAQRDFGKSIRSVALARRPSIDASVTISQLDPPPVGADKPPGLMVEPEEIRLTDIYAADFPLTERVYVFNRGGGALSWDADSDNEWISLEIHAEFVKVSIGMPSGRTSRGSIYIRDRGAGGVRKVPVTLQMRSQGPRPRKHVSEPSVPREMKPLTVEEHQSTPQSDALTKPEQMQEREKVIQEEKAREELAQVAQETQEREKEVQDEKLAIARALPKVSSVDEYLEGLEARLVALGYGLTKSVKYEGGVFPFVARKTEGGEAGTLRTTTTFLPMSLVTPNRNEIRSYFKRCLNYVKAQKASTSDTSVNWYVPVIVGVALFDPGAKNRLTGVSDLMWITGMQLPGLTISGVACLVDLADGSVLFSKPVGSMKPILNRLRWVASPAKLQ